MRAMAVLLAALAVAGCGPAQAPVIAPPDGQTADEPEAPAVTWTPVGEIRTYDAGNLWDAINGAADGYLAYGFVRLTIQDYAAEGVSARSRSTTRAHRSTRSESIAATARPTRSRSEPAPRP